MQKNTGLFIVRLLIACLFGLTVGWQALSTGHRVAGERAMRSQRSTISSLNEINREIAKYRATKKKLPPTLENLWELKDNKLQGRKGELIKDSWRKPYQYTVKGDHYLIISYGEDGRPGGVGINQDLTSENPSSQNVKMPLAQFLTYSEMQGMVQTACLSGALSAFLCFKTLSPALIKRGNLPKTIASGLVLLLATCLVAGIITALHLPSH